MYSNIDIERAIVSGDLTVYPLWPEPTQPASLELHLDRLFRTFQGNRRWVNVANPPDLTKLRQVIGPIRLKPGEFILASTQEKVTLSNRIAARIEGKSSLGRLGLSVHITAGFIDPGFSGHLTLEIKNMGRYKLELPVGIAICQLALFRLDTPTDKPYGSPGLNSHYQDQAGPTPAEQSTSIRPPNPRVPV